MFSSQKQSKISYKDGGVILIGEGEHSFNGVATGGFVEIGSRTFMVYHARESGNTDDSQRFICVSEVGFVNRTIDGVSVPVMCCVSAGFGCELLPTCNYTNLLLNATIKGHSFLQDASYLVDGLVYNNDNCTALTEQYHASKYDVVTLDFSTAISLNSLMIYAGDDVRLSNFESIRQILLTDSSGNVYRISNQSFDRPASGGDGMFLSFETLVNIVQIQLSFSSDMAISEIKGYLIND